MQFHEREIYDSLQYTNKYNLCRKTNAIHLHFLSCFLNERAFAAETHHTVIKHPIFQNFMKNILELRYKVRNIDFCEC